MWVKPRCVTVTPRRASPGISVVKPHLNPLNPPGFCSCPPPQKKSWGAHTPLHPNLIHQKSILILSLSAASAPRYLLRAGGWLGG